MIRCPKCSKLTVRDTQRCSCGHRFDGAEPDATPTQEDVREWERSSAGQTPSAPEQLQTRTATRVVILGVVVAFLQFVIPLTGRPEDMRGSLVAYIAFPILFGVQWLVISAVSIALFNTRKRAGASLLACIGGSFLLALLSMLLLAPRILTHGGYGPGP